MARSVNNFKISYFITLFKRKTGFSPYQYRLRELGYPVPEDIHIPLLTDCHGRRLAKRDKDLSLDELSKRYTPQQLLVSAFRKYRR